MVGKFFADSVRLYTKAPILMTLFTVAGALIGCGLGAIIRLVLF